MGSTLFSFVIWYWRDAQTDIFRVQVVDVDTGKDVLFRDSSFLLRVFVDESTSVPRCFLRHISSGREVYIQSGPNLLAFIKGCLATDDETEANETADEGSLNSRGPESP
jgi:hypothetical protein